MSRMRIKKLSSNPVKLNIQKFNHDGRGIAQLDGKVTFVTGGLPGETVLAKYTLQKSRYAEAEVMEILEASPKRIAAKCAVFGRCGGCVLQHLSSNDQIEYKQQVLAEQLQHFGQVAPEQWLAPVQGDPWGYRRKARLGVRYVAKKGGVLIGFREQNGRFLTDTQACEILHPSVGQRLAELRCEFAQLAGAAVIPQIEVAVDDHRPVLTIRHLEPLCEQDQQRLVALAERYQWTLYLQPGGPDSVQLLSPQSVEPLRYCLPDHQIEILFGPADFTQVNMGINRLMVNLALQLLELKPTDRVLDLFCGLGNFSLPIARYVSHVCGVEGDMPMVKRAETNASHNHLNNVEFHVANLFEVTGQEAFLKRHCNKVLLDPPRAGAEQVVRHFAAMGVERIVYVSCNPATLARDAGILVNELGYQFTHAGVLDMFPHTSHVESIALFLKQLPNN